MAEYMMESYQYYFYDLTDTRVRGRFLMESPLPFFLIIVSYILFVKWVGPWWMKDRPAFNVEKPMLLYNIVQMIINTHFVYVAISKGWMSGRYNVICHQFNNEPDPLDDLILEKIHLFLLSRLLDLLDTVFMVLKKNNHQVSFLHVYHHLMVASVGWFTVKYLAGGNLGFFGTINSFVHIVMYFYYFLTAYDPSYKKSMWWKKQITQMQLIQFAIVLFQQLLAYFSDSCVYPKSLVLLFLSQLIIITYLFVKFYLISYVQTQKQKES